MSNIRKAAISSLLLMAIMTLAGCSNDPMHSPVAAGDQVELTQSLLEFKDSLSGQDYSELVESVAIIRTYDIKSLSVEEYYASLDGKTPAEIITMAQKVQVNTQTNQQ